MSASVQAGEGAKPVAVVGDDDADVRETIAECLTLHGFDVIQAANGLEVLFYVRNARPQVLVLDLNMPRLGGLDALRRIRSFDPSIRVVEVTAETDREVHRQALAGGAVAVLEKPVRFPQLLAELGVPDSPPSQPGALPDPGDEPRVVTEANPLAGLRVLVVDDDAGIRDVLQEFLTGAGCRVRLAADGATAVREVVGSAADVVLLDIEMPGLAGVEALPTIRAVAPEAVVIMVSGTTDTETAKRALAYGAFDYVIKPIDFEYLTRSLEAASVARSVGE
jgi:two-component system, response regulator PdtaR